MPASIGKQDGRVMKMYPALRGKFGCTEYYVVTMSVLDLVGKIQLPSEMKEWKDYSLEDKFQRNLDINRIDRLIAPYFRDDEKRFSSSLVVGVEDDMTFEKMSDVIKEAPLTPYMSAMDDLGFLGINNQKFIPLDGQHRAKAFQTVMEHNPNSELGNDMITMLIIKFDKSLARYIFNKINTYAKPTSKAGKLITNDDDQLAVMTRRLIADGVVPMSLVNVASNSLNKNSPQFTTLPTFYNANKVLLSLAQPPVIGVMNDKERDKNQADIKKEWELLFSGIDEWRDALHDPGSEGDQIRMDLRKNSILGRPIGQLALVKAYVYAHKNGISDTDTPTKDMLIKRLNKIDWNIEKTMWQGVLVKTNYKMMYGGRVVNMASKFISHLIGVPLSPFVKNALLDYIHGQTRLSNKRLPKPVQG